MAREAAMSRGTTAVFVCWVGFVESLTTTSANTSTNPGQTTTHVTSSLGPTTTTKDYPEIVGENYASLPTHSGKPSKFAEHGVAVGNRFIVLGGVSVGMDYDLSTGKVEPIDTSKWWKPLAKDDVVLTGWGQPQVYGNSVIAPPGYSKTWLIYDIVKKTTETVDASRWTGKTLAQYFEGSTIVDSLVVAVPMTADEIIWYDAKTKITGGKNTQGVWYGKYKWQQAVAVGKKVIGIPWNAEKLLIFDTQTKEVSAIATHGLATGVRKWGHASVVGNKVIAAPFLSKTVLIYDVEKNIIKSQAYDKMCLATVTVGKYVYGLPWQDSVMLTVDGDSDVISTMGISGWKGGGIRNALPLGNLVIGIPYNGHDILVYEVDQQKTSLVSVENVVGKVERKFFSAAVVGQRVVLAPGRAEKMVIFTPKAYLRATTTITTMAPTGCVCWHGIASTGSECPASEHKCASCDKGFALKGKICQRTKEHCLEVRQLQEPMGRCYEMLGETTGNSPKDIAKTVASTNTESWAECQGQTSSQKKCAKISAGSTIPLVEMKAEANICDTKELSETVCDGGTGSETKSTTITYKLEGLLGHKAALCAVGKHYEVGGKLFQTFAGSATVECVVGMKEKLVCPGPICSEAVLSTSSNPGPDAKPQEVSAGHHATPTMICAFVLMQKLLCE